LIKIEESVVEIQTRAEDKDAVAGVLKEAVAEYKRLMTEAGHTVNPQVKISNHVLPSKSIGGGIILSALDNRIVLNQTVDERLQITYMDVLPSVRYGLFPERP
jgi:V-type H+-transporting ATPase subunit E